MLALHLQTEGNSPGIGGNIACEVWNESTGAGGWRAPGAGQELGKRRKACFAPRKAIGGRTSLIGYRGQEKRGMCMNACPKPLDIGRLDTPQNLEKAWCVDVSPTLP